MKRIFLGVFVLSVCQYAGNLSDNPMIYKEKSCALGNGSDCNDLAYICYKEQNYKMAYDFLSTSCKYANSEGCLGLGLLCEEGEGVLMNYSKALHFYEMSCKLNNATGCLSVVYFIPEDKILI